MKNQVLLTVVVFLMVNMFIPNSQCAEERLKIGYVDINKVFDAYDKAKGISKLVKAEREKTREEYIKREKEIKEANIELKEKASKLDQQEKEKRKKNLQSKIQELIKFERSRKKKEQEPVGKALAEIYKAVETVGERGRFDIIVEKREGLFGKTVLYAKKSLGLTDEVIKQLLRKH